jgi:hypothetical protein
LKGNSGIRFKTKLGSKDVWIKLLLLFLLIFLGILSKKYIGPADNFINNHLGGIIYVIFWIYLFSFIFPKPPLSLLVLWVFLMACFIECTQLIHTPTLELLRRNFVFRVLFGSTFNPLDFMWYFIGALFGLFSCLLLRKYFIKQNTK